MKNVLLFIYRVYLPVINHRTFSKKHASTAFNLPFGKLVARKSLVEYSVNGENEINGYENKDSVGDSREIERGYFFGLLLNYEEEFGGEIKHEK
jgi:hypothetical protein